MINVNALARVELAGHTMGTEELGKALTPWIKEQRWFNGKDDQIRHVAVDDVFAIPKAGATADATPAGYVLKTTIQHERSEDVTYYLSLAQGHGAQHAGANVPTIQTAQGALRLREGMDVPEFVLGWRELSHGGTLDGAAGGKLVGSEARGAVTPADDIAVKSAQIDSSNTVRFLEPTVEAEPDAAARAAHTEVTKFVRAFDPHQKTGDTPFAGNSREAAMLAHNSGNDIVPHFDGGIVFHGADGTEHSLGLTTYNVPNRGSAQTEALDSVTDMLRQFGGVKPKNQAAALAEIERYAADGAGSQGRALAKLHEVNASGPAGSVFSGSRPSLERRLAEIDELRRKVPDVLQRVQGTPEFAGHDADAVRRGLLSKIDAMEAAARAGDDPAYIQIHGDFHPGQNLVNRDKPGHTITDLEGKPNQTAAENAVPQHAYDDVAQMLGSFDYAGNMSLQSALKHVDTPNGSAYARRRLQAGTDAWIAASKRAFLDEYHAVAGDAAFVPSSAAARDRALDEKLLKIMLHNVNYESGAGRGLLKTPLDQLVAISGARTSSSAR
jgi:predicted trehalose synthase